MAFILLLIFAVIAVCLFINGEKDDDPVAKAWCFVLGVTSVVFAIFIFSQTVKESKDGEYHINDNFYYYDDY